MFLHGSAGLAVGSVVAVVAAHWWVRSQAGRKRKPRPGPQLLDPRFFAARDDAGNLRINTRFIDMFLRWECG